MIRDHEIVYNCMKGGGWMSLKKKLKKAKKNAKKIAKVIKKNPEIAADIGMIIFGTAAKP